MAASATRPSAAASLAPELLRIILAPLSQPDVLSAAAVSSWWRACAVQQPMYYRVWTFLLLRATPASLTYGTTYDTVKQLERVVGEAEASRNNLGLNLSVRLDPDQASVSSSSHSLSELGGTSQFGLGEGRMEPYKATLQAELAPILRRVLARCIVLSVSFDPSSSDILWKGLSFPAPLLRRLNISILTNDTLYSLPGCEPIPAQFLACTAPRLTNVSLMRIGITASSPCFPSVRTLLLYCPLDLHAAHAAFPGTKDLTIQRLACEISDADHAIFGQLESLRLGPDPVAVRELVPALTHIPLIEYHGKRRNDVAGLIPSSGETSLCVYEHVRRRGAGLVQAAPSHVCRPPRRTCAGGPAALVPDAPPRFAQLCLEFCSGAGLGGLTRRVDCDVPFTEACAFGGVRRALPCITDLTIDDRHVRAFFAMWVRFPVLMSLRITLVSWAPGAPRSADEELLYATDHARSACACLGGLFGDRYDGSCPDGDVQMNLPALQTLELRATRPRAVVPLHILWTLSRSFSAHLHLMLANGLALAEHLEAVPLFASITAGDASFCAALPCVSRAAALLAAAAARRKAVLLDTDRALRTHGPSFHWEHCKVSSASIL